MLIGILLIAGIWIILKDKKTRVLWLKWAIGLFVGLHIPYWYVNDGSFGDYAEGYVGILIIALLVGLLATFIHKWVLERKNKKGA